MCNIRSLLFITTALLCSQTYLIASAQENRATPTDSHADVDTTSAKISKVFDDFEVSGTEYLTSCMAQAQTLNQKLLASLGKSMEESTKKENSEEKPCSLPAILKELETTQALLSELQAKQRLAEEQKAATERDFNASHKALTAMNTSVFENVKSLTAASKMDKKEDDDDTIRLFHEDSLETLIAKDQARPDIKNDKQFTDQEIESFCNTFHENLAQLRTNVENFFSNHDDQIAILPYSQKSLPGKEFEALFTTACQMLTQLQNEEKQLQNEHDTLSSQATEEEEEAKNQKSAALQICKKTLLKNQELTTSIRNLFFQSADGFKKSAENIHEKYMTYSKAHNCNNHRSEGETHHFYCVLQPVVKQMHDHLLSTTITNPEDVRTTIGAFSLLHILLEQIRCLERVEGRLGAKNPFPTVKQSVATPTGHITVAGDDSNNSDNSSVTVVIETPTSLNNGSATTQIITHSTQQNVSSTEANNHPSITQKASTIKTESSTTAISLSKKIQKGALYGGTTVALLAALYGRGYYSHSAFLPGQELFNRGFEKAINWASEKGALTFLHNALRAPLAAAKVEKIETLVTVVQKPALTSFASLFPERWILK